MLTDGPSCFLQPRRLCLGQPPHEFSHRASPQNSHRIKEVRGRNKIYSTKRSRFLKATLSFAFAASRSCLSLFSIWQCFCDSYFAEYIVLPPVGAHMSLHIFEGPVGKIFKEARYLKGLCVRFVSWLTLNIQPINTLIIKAYTHNTVPHFGTSLTNEEEGGLWAMC